MSVLSRPLRTRFAIVAALSALTFSAACSGDSITEPSFAPRNGLSLDSMNILFSVTALTRDVAVPEGVVHSFSFTKKGGTIEIKEYGLKVKVPKDAIPDSALTIVVTVLPGRALAYEFQPHGTVFLKPLEFEQDLKYTSFDNLGFKGTVFGGYFKDKSQLDLLKGTALLDEVFPIKFTGKNAKFDIHHFSGYMVSSGRQSSRYDEAF